jgi:hypothetical protein
MYSFLVSKKKRIALPNLTPDPALRACFAISKWKFPFGEGSRGIESIRFARDERKKSSWKGIKVTFFEISAERMGCVFERLAAPPGRQAGKKNDKEEGRIISTPSYPIQAGWNKPWMLNISTNFLNMEGLRVIVSNLVKMGYKSISGATDQVVPEIQNKKA